jgi:hypothetical protein
MATALEDVIRRVTAIADQYRQAKRDDLAAELYEVERALSTATRRLVRVTGASGA